MSRPQKYRARKHLKEVRSMAHKSPPSQNPSFPVSTKSYVSTFSTFHNRHPPTDTQSSLPMTDHEPEGKRPRSGHGRQEHLRRRQEGLRPVPGVRRRLRGPRVRSGVRSHLERVNIPGKYPESVPVREPTRSVSVSSSVVSCPHMGLRDCFLRDCFHRCTNVSTSQW